MKSEQRQAEKDKQNYNLLLQQYKMKKSNKILEKQLPQEFQHSLPQSSFKNRGTQLNVPHNLYFHGNITVLTFITFKCRLKK